MFFLIINIFLMMVYLFKGTKEAEVVTVSFEGSKDGYAVVERAEMVFNTTTTYSNMF